MNVTPRRLAAPLALLALALTLTPASGGRAVAQGDLAFDYAVDPAGRARITVASTAASYYALHVRLELGEAEEEVVAVVRGEDGTTILTEGLSALPAEHYRVTEHAVAAPDDLDGDGIDDLTELADLGALSPINDAEEIEFQDGTVAIPDRETFEALSYQGDEVLIDTHLEDLEFVKFYILGADTESPSVYFMNTERHRSHGSFARAIGLSQGGRGGGRGGNNVPGSMRGEIVYHPQVVAPSGALGVYRFEFEPNDRYPFAEVRMGYELMARNLPFLANDWVYYPMPNAALPRYEQEKALYDASRVKILLEEDIYREVSYLALNMAEGYGQLRVMDLSERPGPRDIVLYEALPNEMPRVGGIITTVPQTPLSHVNLRAIQDGVPNAYILDALADPAIADLVGQLVYYRVAPEGYTIREASLAEVEAHYAALRPAEPQVPERDLDQTAIEDLDDIGFPDWRRFGVKAANMAAMRDFGFPEGTIEDGFAVPFSFYDEFMKHNGFYDDVQALLDDPTFQSDYDTQVEALDDLRDEIEDGEMPDWMMEQLARMQAAFPEGTPIRTRSSTNNEDLPGFSGAGLYDSYTHRPDEGHIAKSIKQVYASLWNFRAFDERQFYRIDHFQTAMGVLVHENFDDEKANGVGVSTDPIYGTRDTYYLNSQVGENLVTNPEALSIPEEILLGAAPGSGFSLIRPSNQVPAGELVMTEPYLEQMRGYLGTILREFRTLYGAEDDDAFAMEIEYKITADDVLAIKQARPWITGDEPAETPATPEPSATPAPATPSPPATQEPPGEPARTIFLPSAMR